MEGSRSSSPDTCGGAAAEAESSATKPAPTGRRWCLCKPCVLTGYHHSAKNYKDHHKNKHRDCTLASCPFLQSGQELELLHAETFGHEVLPALDPRLVKQEQASALLGLSDSARQIIELQDQVRVLREADVRQQENLSRLAAVPDPATDHVSVMLQFLSTYHADQLIAAADKLKNP